jgi:peptidyl-prolyl cis-trans isomerase C
MRIACMPRCAARDAARPAPRPVIDLPRFFLAALAIGVMATLGCRPGSDEPTVLAIVNARPVTLEELDYRWAELPPSTQARYRREGGKRRFLDELITRELLLQEARRRGLDQSLSIRQRLARQKEQLMLEELTKEIGSEADARDEMTEQELELYYVAHAVALLANEQIRLAQIVVPTVEQAKDLKQQLEQGADFGKLAQQFSTDTATKNKGGDLGIYRKSAVEPEVEPALVRLMPGMVSDPIKTSRGIHLIKVVSREITDKDEHAAVRQRLQQELHAEKSRRRFEQLIAKLKGAARVRTADSSRLVVEDVRSSAHPNP